MPYDPVTPEAFKAITPTRGCDPDQTNEPRAFAQGKIDHYGQVEEDIADHDSAETEKDLNAYPHGLVRVGADADQYYGGEQSHDGDLALARKKRECATENGQHYFIDEISHAFIVTFVAVFSVL